MRRGAAGFLAAAAGVGGLIALGGWSWRGAAAGADGGPDAARVSPAAPGRAPGGANVRAIAPADVVSDNSLRNVSDAEIAAALHVALRAPGRAEREAVYGGRIAAWAAQAPTALERALAALGPDTPEVAEARGRVAAQLWAARDFPAAYRWASQLEDPAARALALASVFYQSAGEAPQATLELAQTAPLGEGRELVLQRLALQWAAGDGAAATAWAMAQPATESRDGVFQQLALARVAADPAGAAHLIRFGISPGSVQEDAVAQALARWPVAESPRAVAWVRQFPAGALRRRAEVELGVMLAKTR